MGKSLKAEDQNGDAKQIGTDDKNTKKRKKIRNDAEEEVAINDGDAEDTPANKEERNRDGDDVKQVKKAKKRKENSDSAPEPDATVDTEAEKYRQQHLIYSKGESTLPDPLTNFDDLPFHKKVVAEMKKAGFQSPSPIQAQGWPVVLNGMDLIAIAKTGSGKTLAFLIPLFHRILHSGSEPTKGRPDGLVLAPTRELAMQIKVECDRFGACAGVKSCCIYGGVPSGPQRAELSKQQNLVIATPGRLNDMLSQNAVDIKSTMFLVLDEADRMLDMGFEPQIKRIVAAMPNEGRQTLFFTATWPKAVRKLAKSYLRSTEEGKTVRISVGGGEDSELEANKAIVQEFFQVTDDAKDAKLWQVIQGLPPGARMVCFANTKRRVDYLAKALWDEGLGTCAIHGEYPLMFATDVAARGLDIKGVTHVLNFDMARDVESYVHRIGRTGRAVLFCTKCVAHVLKSDMTHDVESDVHRIGRTGCAGLSGASITFWNPDYDKECAPALAKIARDAGCPVPDWLERYASGKAGKAWKPENAVVA